MSNHGDNPADFDFKELGGFGGEPEAGAGAPEPPSLDEGFGDEGFGDDGFGESFGADPEAGSDFRIEDMPLPSPGDTDDADEFAGEAFGDVAADAAEGDEGREFGVDFTVDGEQAEDAHAMLGADEEGLEGVAPVVTEGKARRDALISKLAYPVGGAALLGVVAYVGWPMFAGLLGLNSQAPAPQFQPAPTQQAAPQLPGQTGVPRLPVAQAPVPQAQAPQLPAAPQLPPAQAPAPVAEAPAAPALPVPATAAPSLPGVPVSGLNRPAVETQPQVSGGIEAALNRLVEELRTLNSKIEDFDARLKATKDEVAGRIEKMDGKVADMQAKVGEVEQKLGALEQRLAALEAARGDVGQTKAATAPKAAPTRAVAKAAPAAAPTKTLTGFTLRGVSRSAALVEAKGGLHRVQLGSEVPGAGVAKEIRHEGGTWVLVTSAGIIRP